MSNSCVCKHVSEDLVGPEVLVIDRPQTKNSLKAFFLKPVKIKLVFK